ncbi:hypothetical protein [Kitasatospora purpeofusca]|uniref:hypothetical protein n=1 Tax=Kitasatospora purpeofusca TaxID=67352 RepID=UPI0036B505FE
MARKTLKFATVNIEYYGQCTDARGNVDTTAFWSIHDRLAELDLTVLFVQEMTDRWRSGARLRYAAENRLGMRSWISPMPAHADGEKVNPTGLFVRPGVFEMVGEWPQTRGWWTPPTAISVRLPGASSTLQLASAHGGYPDPVLRAGEARKAAAWQTRNQAVIFGADSNSHLTSPVEHNPLPDWSSSRDTTHREHRTLDGRTSDRTPHEILTRAGLEDAALYAATHLGQPDAVAPTASMYPHVSERQGPPQRIDLLRMSRALLPALERVDVIPLEGTDHALVVAHVDADGLTEGLNAHAAFDYSTPLWAPGEQPASLTA